MPKLRVLVVEDSKTVRARILEVLSTDDDIEIAGEAQDGKRAIELCRDLRPDVITLDMMMPVMTGLAATEYIMAHCPTPILIVSSSVNRGELFRTYDALAAGAVDVLEKPTGEEAAGVWEAKFIAAVKLVARIKVITHPRGRLGLFSRRPVGDTGDGLSPAVDRPSVVAIGASTGGPGAIVDVLRTMPPGIPTPILFVLHIGEPFGTAFADWLDGQSSHRVSYARDGEPLASATGRVVMAPPGKHLRIRDRTLWLTSEPERHFVPPVGRRPLRIGRRGARRVERGVPSHGHGA